MKIKLLLALFAGLVRDVAGFAAHIQRYVTAALLGHIHARVVAAQTKVLFLITGRRLQQLKFIVGLMWIVAFQAVASAGGCTLPLISAAFLSAWQVRHRL